MKKQTQQIGKLLLVMLFFTSALVFAPRLFQKIYAAEGEMEWVASVDGGPMAEIPYNIADDDDGNTYITGAFDISATFGAGEPNETILTSDNPNEMFVAKYNPDGTLAWAKGTRSPNAVGYGIAVDNSGNVYVCGNFMTEVTFGVGEPGEITLYNTPNSSFLTKYNPDGSVNWAKHPQYGNNYYNMKIDSFNNFYVTSDLANNIIKYDPDGNLVWIIGQGSIGGISGLGLDSSGNSYIAGSLYGIATFGAGEPSETVLTDTISNSFMAKYNPDGSLLWARYVLLETSSSSSRVANLNTDHMGNIYVTGRFQETARFGPGDPNETILTSSGSSDIFIAKFNTNGTIEWAKSAGGINSNESGLYVAVDDYSNCYVTGQFRNGAIFGAGEPNETILDAPYYYTGDNIFLAKYNPYGTFMWAKKPIDSTTSITLRGMIADNSGNSFLTGEYTDGVFGSGDPNETFLNPESGGIFIAKFEKSSSPGYDFYDFGDSPYPYPTLLADNGANHSIDGQTYLGASIDPELDGQSDSMSLGDDNNGIYDEEGVTFGTFAQGNNATLTVEASLTGYLNAWIDWNADGDWQDQDEQIFTDELLTSGINNLNVTVPGWAPIGHTYARFRFSSNTGISYEGLANDGEVEDYRIEIVETGSIIVEKETKPDGLPGQFIFSGDISGTISDGESIVVNNLVPGQYTSTENNAPAGIDLISITCDDTNSSGTTVTSTATFNVEPGEIVKCTFTSAVLDYGDAPDPDYPTSGQISSASLNWAKSDTPSGSNTGDGIGYGIAVDNSQNSYVTGYYKGMAVFGEGEPNETTLTGSGQEIFVAKYNSDGTLAWATDAGGSSSDKGYAIAVDKNGNSYVTGVYSTSAVFGKGEPHETTVSGAYYEIFVAKYNSDGSFVWVKDAGGANPDYGQGIAIDSGGHIYVTGYYIAHSDEIIVFGEGEVNETSLPGTEYYEIFVAKYNSDGTLTWAKNAGGIYDDYGTSIAVDITGNIYVTGYFSQIVTFGLSEPNQTTLASGQEYEIFVAKYDNSGAVIWAKSAGGSGKDRAYGLTVDYTGNVYVTGSFYGQATFGEGINEINLSSDIPNAYELFVAKYDNKGALIWAKNDGSTASISGYGIEVNNKGESYVTGYFYESAIFGAGELNETTLSGKGQQDIFTAKYDYNGNFVWAKSAGGSFNSESGRGIIIDNKNNVYLTGNFYDSAIFGEGEPNETILTRLGGGIFVAKYSEISGASHILDKTTYLGPCVDSETNEQQSINANEDDNNYGTITFGTCIVSGDDEDGVTLGILSPENTTTIDIEASTSGYLNAWIDFNADGDWADAAEQIFTDEALNAGINNLSIYVPVDAKIGSTYSRFRFTSYDTSGALTFTGEATDGEVEDYLLPINSHVICSSSLCNGSFESVTDLEYWTSGNGTNLTVSDIVQEGSKSYYTEHTYDTGENPRWSGIWQKILVESTQTYGLSGFYRSENAAQGHIKVTWKDISETILQVYYPVINMNGTNTSWIEFNKLVTAPVGAFTAEIKIWHGINTSSQNVLGSKLWMDNLTFDVATTSCGTLCNESFEHGALYWVQSGVAGSHIIEQTDAYEGTKTLKSEQLYTAGDPTKWTGVTQYVHVKEGTEYRLRGWFKAQNAVNGHLRIRWRDTGGGLISSQYPVSGINGTNSTWFAREATVTAPAGSTIAEITIWHGVNSSIENVQGSTLWIDNITMICPILCNGGFEDGNIHWETNGTNEGEIITTDVYEGSKALKIVQNELPTDQTQWAGISQRLMVTGGESYDLAFRLKKENVVQGHVKVKWRDSNDQIVSQQFPISGINGTDLTWSQINVALTAPANAETAEVFILHGVDGSNQNVAGSTLYLDNIMFIQIP